jgi:hypothetical protein
MQTQILHQTQSSKIIAEINTDRDAPIVGKFYYRIVGGFFEGVPMLTQTVAFVCPFRVTMLGDGISDFRGNMNVKNISEIIDETTR